MMVGIWLRAFAHDEKVQILLLLLLILDLPLGILASLRVGNFRLSYIADFLRNDVLFKVVPYFFVYAASIVAGNTDILVPGFDFGFIAGGAYAFVIAGLVGSILSSLKTLGFLNGLTDKLAGSENAAPPKD